MGKFNFDDMIALLLMDIIRNKSKYEYDAKIEEMLLGPLNTEDELVGSVDRDLLYEYQMDRVKEVKDED
jgi:hypothetical protein|tara:strand:+ start:950 stop:1156 length:207 start_codon:yes stop_codon:yes gene_type:complete